MLEPKRESLDKIIEKIRTNRILLPDFQRQFVWTEVEVQSKLVASVLTKMPLGSVLLLQTEDPTEYACKIIGSKKQLPKEKIPTGQVDFLLDGQQRITVLANVFSDVIFHLSDAGDLTAPTALKRRFFLKIPKLSNEEVQDLFGLRMLHFPLLQAANDEPQFLTGDILPFIHVIPFNVTKDKDASYNPYNSSSSRITELESFCVSGDDKYYYIPLFLLVENGATNINSNSLKNVLSTIAKQIVTIRMSDLGNLIANGSEVDNLRLYIEEHTHKDIYTPYFDKSCFESGDNEKISAEFKRNLEMHADYWSDNMFRFLQSCLSQIDLSQIVLEKSQRGRAIDIYENLNRGGVSLDIFDLLMARVAQVTTGRFYDRLISCISAGTEYPLSVVGGPQTKKDLQALVNAGTYHASERMGCYDEKKNEIPKAYLESFLNVLSLCCYVPDFCASPSETSPYSVDLIKRPKKLDLKAAQINDNCENCCTYLDRACFFFQTRCGLRYLREINYTLMLPIVAYIFSDDQSYNDCRVFDLLEGWYWASIFSGAYDRDQNQTMINDLRHLVSNALEIRRGETPDLAWLADRRHRVLAEENFSTKRFLLLEDVDNDDYPKQVITAGISQYYLSCEYQDLEVNTDEAVSFLTVFASSASGLQQHHVIPLGASGTVAESTKTLRKDKRNILNSPLNLMYISDRANQNISSRSLSEYAQLLPTGAKLQNLGFPITDISATASDEKKKEALEKRFESFRAKLVQEINLLLSF